MGFRLFVQGNDFEPPPVDVEPAVVVHKDRVQRAGHVGDSAQDVVHALRLLVLVRPQPEQADILGAQQHRLPAIERDAVVFGGRVHVPLGEVVQLPDAHVRDRVALLLRG